MKGLNTLFWILRSGYFPKELPPSFSTWSFAKYIRNQVSSSNAVKFSPIKKSSEVTRHSLARAGGMRRNLGIPNPYFYANLAIKVAQNWRKMQTFSNASKFSQSKPTLSSEGRAIHPSKGIGELAAVKARTRANARYILQTDISEFYRSLYTQYSVVNPW